MTMLYSPDGVNLMWNTAMPLLSVIAWIPTLIGGPVFAHDVLLVLAIAASGWTAWLALRRYAGDGLGPLIGGAVYAFSPYIASHAAIHLNLTAASCRRCSCSSSTSSSPAWSVRRGDGPAGTPLRGCRPWRSRS